MTSDRPSIEPSPGGVTLSGAWTAPSIARAPEVVKRLDRIGPQPGLRWDLQPVTELDLAGALLLWRTWNHSLPERLSGDESWRDLFDQLDHHEAGAVRPTAGSRLPPVLRPVQSLGDTVLGFPDDVGALVRMLGQLALDGLHLVRRPSQIPWREISATVYRAGARALPITGLVGFMIGVVLTYLSVGQLRDFGAESLIVNLVGIGLFRELGPLLGCMLLAGRSGSAMTAELGVMRMTQEIDALATMGVSPSIRLILPNVLALAFAAPLIAGWTGTLGILGGMLVAAVEAGIGPAEFLIRLRDALPAADVMVGIGKSFVFGIAIALIACFYGLRGEPNASSLGQQTTGSVVSGLASVIALDAMFAFLLTGVGTG